MVAGSPDSAQVIRRAMLIVVYLVRGNSGGNSGGNVIVLNMGGRETEREREREREREHGGDEAERKEVASTAV